jgi:hypothetical protein
MRWVRPTAERVSHIAFNLRSDDKTEVWLSHHIAGDEAVFESWLSSEICRCIVTSDGEPVGVTGVCGDRIWLLGTEGLTATRSRRLQLCIEGRGWVEHCLKHVGGPIGNDVYAKNRMSIRWLRHLGFEVEEPRPIGLSGALFCRFWREA